MTSKRLGIFLTTQYDGSGTRQATTGLEDVEEAAQGAEQGMEDTGKAGVSMGQLLGGAAVLGAVAALGRGLVQFGKASLLAASDVEEMQSKFDAVFKDQGGSVTAALEDFADAANRSVFDLQGFAATLQDTFVPLGFARDKAADMSVEIVKLAEDLASFNNLPTQQVVEDLQSALVGNTETLRKYGVVASQAAIDQKALELGLSFTKGQMDAQTKAAAILALTLEGTSDAQGDAIRTSESFANKMKGAEAAIKDLSVGIGQELLPAATSLIDKFTTLVEDVTPDLIDSTSDFLRAVELSSEGYRRAARHIEVLTTNYLILNGMIDASIKRMGFFNDASELFAKTFGPAWRAELKEMEKAVPPVDDEVDNLGDGIDDLGDSADGTGESLNTLTTTIDDMGNAAEAAGGKMGTVAQETEGARKAAENYAIHTRNARDASAEIEERLRNGLNPALEETRSRYEGVNGEIQEAWDKSNNLAAMWEALSQVETIDFRYQFTQIGDPMLLPPGGFQAPGDTEIGDFGGGGGSSNQAGTGLGGPQAPGDAGPDGSPGSTLPGSGEPTPNGPGGAQGGRSGNQTNNFNFFGGNNASAGAIANEILPRG